MRTESAPAPEAQWPDYRPVLDDRAADRLPLREDERPLVRRESAPWEDWKAELPLDLAFARFAPMPRLADLALPLPPSNAGTGPGPLSSWQGATVPATAPPAQAGGDAFSWARTEQAGFGGYAQPLAVGMLAPANAGDPDTPGEGSPVVISEAWGGSAVGGPYNRDFVELFNRSDVPYDLDGTSLQYATATGSTWQAVALSGVIAPGQYLLVALGPTVSDEFGDPVGTPLPTPDLVAGSINPAANGGKVALVADTAALAGAQPDVFSPIIDLAGYGSASAYEGATAAPGGSATLSVQRLDGGLTDTDQNGPDFAATAPTPKNSTMFHSAHANLAPIVATPYPTVYAAGAAVTFDDTGDNFLFIDDYDAVGQPVRATLTASAGTFTLATTTGLTFTAGDGTADATMTFTGTVNAINAALDGLAYAPGTGYTGNATLTASVDDLGNNGTGGAKTTTGTVQMAFGPAVTVEATDALAIREGQDTAELVIRRHGDTSSLLTVSYAMGGTAAFGTDYVLTRDGVPLLGTGSLVFAPGVAEAAVVLTPIDNGTTEDRTFELTLTGTSAGHFVAAGMDKGKGDEIKKMKGTDKAKLADGVNYEAAHALSKGTGIKVGVIEASPQDKGGARPMGLGIDTDCAPRPQQGRHPVEVQQHVLRREAHGRSDGHAAGEERAWHRSQGQQPHALDACVLDRRGQGSEGRFHGSRP
ncbi:MAG: lamin tail domain-containing protein [Gemmataceae bacterium]|nr:lamin tail domain-containing protein [Gemmataceae bacterium]